MQKAKSASILKTTKAKDSKKVGRTLGAPALARQSRVPAATSAAKGVRNGSKIETLLKLMKAKSGATIDQLVRATGWQTHSVRGAISGNVKKKLGLHVQSARVKGVRVYRIGR